MSLLGHAQWSELWSVIGCDEPAAFPVRGPSRGARYRSPWSSDPAGTAERAPESCRPSKRSKSATPLRLLLDVNCLVPLALAGHDLDNELAASANNIEPPAETVICLFLGALSALDAPRPLESQFA